MWEIVSSNLRWNKPTIFFNNQGGKCGFCDISVLSHENYKPDPLFAALNNPHRKSMSISVSMFMVVALA